MVWSAPVLFKISWVKYPFVRICTPFILGILLADHMILPVTWIASGIIGCLILLISAHVLARKRFAFRDVFGVVSTISYFLFGMLWLMLRDERNLIHHFSTSAHTELITTTYYLEEKDRFWDCYSHVLYQIDQKGSHPSSGKILIRIPKTFGYHPHLRDQYHGIYRVRVPDKATAPYEFDWNRLLHHRNIHHLVYLDTNAFKILYRASPNFVERSRLRLDQTIQQIVPNARDYPVASAMLLGLRKKMDPELYKAYSATGAVHILAVSGLHVGILAHIFTVLFSFLPFKSRYHKLIQLISVLIIIWGYTILTGATPSIMRSALMFSLMMIAAPLRRDTAPMNILAGTAFVLLLINPLDLFNIGFQLSFGAMAGIFLLYDPIRKLFNPTHNITQALWSITSVALGAQLMIYPIVGYHFHQFAFYFWLTSFISTPFSYLIILGGMMAIPIQWLGISILYFLKYPLILGVSWMNNIIAWIYTLPLGKVTGWWPTVAQCIILVTLSFAIAHCLIKKTWQSYRAPILCLILFMLTLLFNEWIYIHRTELVASFARGHAKVFVKDGPFIIILQGDSTLVSSNYIERYNIKPEHIFRLDSLNLKYRTDHLLINRKQIDSKSDTYRVVLHRADSFTTVPDQNVLLMTKWWKPESIIVPWAPKQVFTSSDPGLEDYAKLFPASKIVTTKNLYFQVKL